MNKQIQEMAKAIHKAKMNDIIAKVTGDIEDFIDCPPMNVSVAEALYNAGYRRASDVENAICAAIEKDFSLAIKRLEKAKLNLIGDMRIYADGKLSAYKSILSDLPRIIGLYKESEGADDE